MINYLLSIGHILSSKDHIEVILNGLSIEYDTFIVSVTSRTNSYTIGEIEYLLMAQEHRSEKQ